jgi:hypothetical protein
MDHPHGEVSGPGRPPQPQPWPQPPMPGAPGVSQQPPSTFPSQAPNRPGDPAQPFPYGAPPGPQPRVPAGVLAGVTLWRLTIVVFACVGFFSLVADVGLESAVPGLSQQASLFTAIVYTGLLLYPACSGGRRHEPRSPWWRGATAVLMAGYLLYGCAKVKQLATTSATPTQPPVRC